MSTPKQEPEKKSPITSGSTSTIPLLVANDERLNYNINLYLQYEKFESHQQYITKLVQENDVEALRRLVGTRLEFGTAGIRGAMGPGFSQMNDLVIIQTSQGLVSYLLSKESNCNTEKGVIIGFDARYNSDRFARLCALAFLQKGIHVYFCDHIIPTPLIAFGVKHFGCCAGVMITASHNPKNDNGYKVFWSNGAQIISPHDKGIQSHIMNNLEPWSKAWDHTLLLANNQHTMPASWNELVFRVHGDLSKSYFAYIESLVEDRRPFNSSAGICITYTTMHGVGHVFLSRALDTAGFSDIFPVELQKKPDPDFSTVKFPNPEESGALDLAFETARHANSNLILALDPDADRCAVAIFDPQSGYKRILNGNEIGALLGWWIWHQHSLHISEAKREFAFTDSQALNVDGLTATADQEEDQERQKKFKKAADCYMISTAVSSKFLRSMARVQGFHFVETLTGFKYMGNFADQLMSKHEKSVLFAYEEAIGYMVDASILDKDGISAAIQVSQCAAYLMSTYKRTLEQHLDWLYTNYGYHYSLNSYYICSDQSIIREIFHNLQADYPKDFGSKFKVKRVRDLNKCYDSGMPDHSPELPCSSSSFMVTFFVDDDITFTIRTSGTEPKIKYYSEIVAKLPEFTSLKHIETNNFNEPEQMAAKVAAQERLGSLVEAALVRCLRPDHYELEKAD